MTEDQSKDGTATSSNEQQVHEEVKYLESVILGTDMLCDAASLLSPRSVKSLLLIGMFGSEHLELFVPVTAVDYIDGKPITPAISYPIIRADLESNLALMYTIQMYLPEIGAIKLKEERDELFCRSERRLNDLGNQAGKVKLMYYKAMSSYFPAACSAIQREKGIKTNVEQIHSCLGEAISLFEQTSKAATGYHELYNTFSLFNLGRVYFALGEKDKAEQKLKEALESPAKNHKWVKRLVGWHMENLTNSSFGTVLSDPPGVEEEVRSELKSVFVNFYGGGDTGKTLLRFKIEEQYGL